jgi:hypothetical protein
MMGEISRSEVLELMQKAFAKLKDTKKVSYGLIQKEAALIYIEEHRELVQNGERPELAAERYYQNEPQSFVFVEAFWHLVTLGFILPEPTGAQPPTFVDLTITKLGREWAEGTEPSPEDQSGYLAALGSQIPLLDSVITQYVEEAVKAYSRRMFFASAVMIGAGSEKTIYLLMEALAGSVLDPAQKKVVRKAIDERKLPTMYKCLHENLARAKKHMPWTIHEDADAHLVSLQAAIRVQRNDAVHPQAGRVTQRPSDSRSWLSLVRVRNRMTCSNGLRQTLFDRPPDHSISTSL